MKNERPSIFCKNAGWSLESSILSLIPSTPFNLFFRYSNKLNIMEIFADYKTIPLKNSLAFNLNSSAFFSSSVISPLAAFSSAIFNHL